MKWTMCGLSLCSALVACGGGTGGDWAGTVTDSAGVAIVANPDEGLWGAAGAWSVAEELRIGALDGDPDYQFGAIVWVDVDAEGRIYVVDQQAQNIRVFDREGAFLNTIGRPGDGPGELSRGAAAVVVGPGDTLFVPDPMQQRVNRFLPDGTFGGSFPLPLTEGIPTKWALLPGGRLAQESRPMPMPLPGQERRDPVHAVLVRATDGSVTDTLLRLPAGETFQMQGGAPRIRLFEPEPVWDAGPDGSTYSGINTDYRIEVRSPDGGLTRIVTRRFERLAVSEADRQAFLDAFEELFERQGVPPMARQQILQSVEFADHYPAYAALAAGPDGTLWVQHIQSAERVAAAGGSFSAEDVGAPEWDVFDADGRFLGVVSFPDRFRALRFVADRVYGVWRNEMDVQHVLRLRIVRPATEA